MATFLEALTQIGATAVNWHGRLQAPVIENGAFTRFVKLLQEPFRLNQGPQGCCGFAAVIMSLLERDLRDRNQAALLGTTRGLVPTLCQALLDEGQQVFGRNTRGNNIAASSGYSNIRQRLLKRCGFVGGWLGRENDIPIANSHLDLWLCVGLMIAFKDYIKSITPVAGQVAGQVPAQPQAATTTRNVDKYNWDIGHRNNVGHFNYVVETNNIMERCLSYSEACVGTHQQPYGPHAVGTSRYARDDRKLKSNLVRFTNANHRKKGDLALTKEGLIELLHFVWHKLSPLVNGPVAAPVAGNPLHQPVVPVTANLILSVNELLSLPAAPPQTLSIAQRNQLWDRLADVIQTNPPGGCIVGMAGLAEDQTTGHTVTALGEVSLFAGDPNRLATEFGYVNHWVYIPPGTPVPTDNTKTTEALAEVTYNLRRSNKHNVDPYNTLLTLAQFPDSAGIPVWTHGIADERRRTLLAYFIQDEMLPVWALALDNPAIP